MHRGLLLCILMACCLVAVQGCGYHRVELVDQVVPIDSYSLAHHQPEKVQLRLEVGPEDRLKTASAVKETPSQVEVTVVVTGPDPEDPRGGVASSQILTAEVALLSELGERDLIDTSTGKAIPERQSS